MRHKEWEILFWKGIQMDVTRVLRWIEMLGEIGSILPSSMGEAISWVGKKKWDS